jgi:hypothetical protein
VDNLPPLTRAFTASSPRVMSDEEQKKAGEHKAQGNTLFEQDRFREAAEEYSAAIELVILSLHLPRHGT